jgi:hypothetical protein
MLRIRRFIAGVNRQEKTPKGEVMHGSIVASLFDTDRSLYLITIPAKAPSSRHPAVVIPPEKKKNMCLKTAGGGQTCDTQAPKLRAIDWMDKAPQYPPSSVH